MANQKPLEAISLIETAIRNQGGKDLTISSMSAVALYQVLKNLDAAGVTFADLALRFSPTFIKKINSLRA